MDCIKMWLFQKYVFVVKLKDQMSPYVPEKGSP